MRCGTLICFRFSCLVLLFWCPVFRGMVILSLKSHSPLPPPTPLTPLPPPPPNLQYCCCCWKWEFNLLFISRIIQTEIFMLLLLLLLFCSLFLSSFYTPFFLSVIILPSFFVSLILASSFYSFIYTKRLHVQKGYMSRTVIYITVLSCSLFVHVTI